MTIETIKSHQKQDPVLQKNFHWLTTNDKPLQIDALIASNSFFLVYYKLFNQLYINHETKFIHLAYPNLHDSNPSQRDKNAYHLNYFMHISTNFTHLDIQELKYPSKFLTIFISYHV